MSVRAVLIDMDGVLWVGPTVVPGAPETVEELRARGLRLLFATNTTRRPLAAILEQADSLGIAMAPEEILAPARIVRELIAARPGARALLLVDPSLREDLGGIAEAELGDPTADFVVMGDVRGGFTREQLSGALPALLRGARLVALHKNRFWRGDEGLRIDLGAYVAGLEYAADVKAVTVGKPSADYFRAALRITGVKASEAAMIGDDVESDIGGAQAVGMTGILVRTGKFEPHFVARSPVTPNHIVDSIVEAARLKLLQG
jgi:HAD superfamily hydrolase (TIGR01458 family)